MTATPAKKLLRLFNLRTALTVAAAIALAGCMNKTVSLNTEPQGATLTVTKMQGAIPSDQVTLDNPTTPTSVKLHFDQNVTYTVEAKKPQYFPAKTVISYEPQSQTSYTIPLTQYEKDTTQVSFNPTRGPHVWQITPSTTNALAYLIPQNEPTDNTVVIQPVQVTPTIKDIEVDYPALAVSPTADVMVYQRAEHMPDGSWHSQLYRQPTSGGPATRLTRADAQEYGPTFTFGGDYVVFSSDNISENATLWKIKLEAGGTLLTNLTRSDALDYAPTAGQAVMAYTSIPPRGIESQVWISRLDGTQAGFLRNGSCPQISPDDKRILFLQKGRAGFYQIWIMDQNGSNLSQVTYNNSYDVADPRWSPDGQWIAYSSFEAKDQDGVANSDIWIIAADGSPKKIRVTYNGSFDGSPSWDRSGKSIYFRSNRGGTWNIWKTDLKPGVIDTPPAAN